MDPAPPPPYDKADDQAAYLGVPDSPPAYVLGALVGGLLAGVLSGGCGTSCCCAPFFGGAAGVLAAMTAARPAYLFGPAEGAIAGAAAGAAGAVLSALITIPIQVISRQVLLKNPQLLNGLPPDLRNELMRSLQSQNILELVIPVAIGAVVLFVACVVGGAIGGVMRRKDGGAI